jgi:hypothetical protein
MTRGFRAFDRGFAFFENGFGFGWELEKGLGI